MIMMLPDAERLREDCEYLRQKSEEYRHISQALRVRSSEVIGRSRLLLRRIDDEYRRNTARVSLRVPA
jgi:hypothetical protein